MIRLDACAWVAVATIAAQQVAPVALLKLPTQWGYRLTPTCYWTPRRWAYALGYNLPVARVDDAGRKASWECQHAHGLKSMVIFSAQIVSRWPDPATLAKWEAEDASQRNTPSPDWAIAPDPD